MKLYSTKTLIQAQKRLSANDDNEDFKRAKEIAGLLAGRLRGFKAKDGTTSNGWWINLTRSGSPDGVAIASSGNGDVVVDIYMRGASGRSKGRNTDIAWDDAVKVFVKNAARLIETSRTEVLNLEKGIRVMEDYISLVFNRI